jgi:hypothetical protein
VHGVTSQLDEVLLRPWVDRQIANPITLGDDHSDPAKMDGIKGREQRRLERSRVRGWAKPDGGERLFGPLVEGSGQIRWGGVFAGEGAEDGEPTLETFEVSGGKIHGRDAERIELRPEQALGIEKSDGQAVGEWAEFGEQVGGKNIDRCGAQELSGMRQPSDEETGRGMDSGERDGGRLGWEGAGGRNQGPESDGFEGGGGVGGELESLCDSWNDGLGCREHWKNDGQ